MGLRIKDVIKEKGTSVQDLADKMGISRVGLSQHINGNPSVEVLERISSALNVEIWQLFTSKQEDGTTGYIEHNGEIHKINSISDIEKLLEEIKKKE